MTVQSPVGISQFRWLLSSQILAMLADVALTLALGVWIENLTGSSSAAGAVFFFFAFPSIVGPLAGPITIRYPERRVLMFTNAVLAISVLALLAVESADRVWIIYAVAMIYGAGQQVIFSARSSFVPDVVEPELLVSANGILESLRQSLRVIGPVIGTGLFIIVGGSALAASVAALLFLSSALLVMTPRGRQVRGGNMSVLSQVVRGFQVLWSSAAVRRMIVVYSVTFSAAGLLEVSLFALVKGGLGQPPGFVAILSMLQGIGSLVGGVMMAPLVERLGQYGGLLSTVAIMCLGFVMISVSAGSVTVGLGFILCGVGLTGFMVSYISMIQNEVEAGEQGLAFLAAEAIGNLPFVFSLAAAASLLEVAGYRVLLWVSAGALAGMTSWLLVSKSGGLAQADRLPPPQV